ncbi:hypothetical protein ACVJDU_001950 [Bradyrhizobium diazoefficiens]
MSTMAVSQAGVGGMTKDERFVILASSLGTVFEWYDFYLYGSLASIIGAQFFSAYPPATRDIFALLAFAAGFLVRPFGAIVFGRIGDIVGRKYTFLVTILIMGLSTFIVGLLPNAATIGIAAPIILIALRLAQGLALGGEYGGCGDLCRGACPQRQARLLHLLHPDHGNARPVPVAAGDPVHPLRDRRSRLRGLGLAHPVPGLGAAARHLGLDPAPPQRIADLPEDEGRGEEFEGAADGSLRQLAERQAGAARAARRRDGPGRGLVHRPVLRAVLPAIDPEGRRLHRQPPDRLVAAARHRLLHRVRHALPTRSAASRSSSAAA